MKLLITGSSGMLGYALRDAFSKDASCNIVGMDLTPTKCGKKPSSFVKCDVTNYDKLTAAVKKIKPDTIIHAAAFTDVDGCELDPDKAETANGLGTRHIAEIARECNATLVYISTDFVFDGRKRVPYAEDDTPNPINVYGRSKLDGERFIKEIMKEKSYFIIRTSWIFGPGGKNFVDTIIKNAQNAKNLKVVSDQFGSPTYTLDLASAVKRLLEIAAQRRISRGVYHITNNDDCSWYKLAQKTLEYYRIYDVELIPIVSDELDRPAERPRMSVLDNNRYIKLSGKPLRNWNRALEDYILLKRRGKDV